MVPRITAVVGVVPDIRRVVAVVSGTAALDRWVVCR